MTYSIFNRDSGNLVESFRSRQRALDFAVEMLQDEDNDPDSIGLIVTEGRRTIETLIGYEITEAAGAEAGQQLPA